MSRKADNHEGGTPAQRTQLASARELVLLVLPIGGLCIALGLHLLLPTVYPEHYEAKVYKWVLLACLVIYIVLAIVSCFVPKLRKKLLYGAPWFFVLAICFEILDILTLKTGILVLPFMPSPDKTFAAYGMYIDQLWENFSDSMIRLFIGLAIGGCTGFISGLLMGWSKVWNYWLAPVLKFIGPLPSAAWVPIVLSFMPTTRAAGLFLISIAMWFPLTLMLSSGIKATPKKQIEAARVLGASEGYILFHVALPSAMNTIFTGIFMGLSSSFSALLVAETMGVKAGLGWYISWSSSWADYARVFATVGIFIVIFFVLIQICFSVRDHVMKWQKGIVQW